MKFCDLEKLLYSKPVDQSDESAGGTPDEDDLVVDEEGAYENDDGVENAAMQDSGDSEIFEIEVDEPELNLRASKLREMLADVAETQTKAVPERMSKEKAEASEEAVAGPDAFLIEDWA